MSSPVELHLSYKLANAPLNTYPFPHLFIEEAFPGDYYQTLLGMLPTAGAMRTIEEVRPVKGYKERFVMTFADDQLAELPEAQCDFWTDLREWLVGSRFGNVVLNKFRTYIDARFAAYPDVEFYDEALLVRDTTNYKLGPHTDAVRKVITLLFYLPRDMSQEHLGTSIYVPKDPDFRCQGGPHHQHDDFDRLRTMPFRPNSLFAFLKTDNSFHGVEPVQDPDCHRWLLLYDIYNKVRSSAPPARNPAAKVKFSF
jgi:hypothetical protein